MQERITLLEKLLAINGGFSERKLRNWSINQQFIFYTRLLIVGFGIFLLFVAVNSMLGKEPYVEKWSRVGLLATFVFSSLIQVNAHNPFLVRHYLRLKNSNIHEVYFDNTPDLQAIIKKPFKIGISLLITVPIMILGLIQTLIGHISLWHKMEPLIIVGYVILIGIWLIDLLRIKSNIEIFERENLGQLKTT